MISNINKKLWNFSKIPCEEFLKLEFPWGGPLEFGKPKYSVLSYPLKEGLGNPKYCDNVSPQMFAFLQETDKTIYETAVRLYL